MSEAKTSEQIYLIAHLVPKPGKEAALKEAITGIVPDVLREPGCLGYVPHDSVDQPGTVVMYEAWKDQAALDAHVAGASFSGLAARFGDLLGAPLRLEKLQRIA